MLKRFKKILFTAALTSLFNNGAWAKNSNFDFSATAISNNVYSIISPSFGLPTEENKGWNSNSYFVITEQGVLVFDTGSSEAIGKGIRSAIKSITDKPVRWVVNSHSHADHWLGNAGVSDASTEIIAHQSAATTMNKYGKDDVKAFSRMTKGATGTSQLAEPLVLLTQAENRNLGGMNVEFIFSGDGHSQGDVLMWLPKQKIIFGGDVLSSDWMPIITPNANVPNLIATLNKVVKLKPSVVLTGHGSATTLKSVKRDASLLASVWQLVKDGYKTGKKLDDIISQASTELAPTYKPLYKNFDTAIKEQVSSMYKMQIS